MLKIKDNVDLRELEKFGFTKTDLYYIYQKEYEETYWINIKTRIIEIETTSEITILNNVLYDLIQANLVEKVEE